MAGIDPTDLEVCLRVLGEVDSFPGEHPDAQAVRSATARLYKTVKRLRRVERREAILANDQAVTAATATGAPGRIDDETRGLPLVSSVRGATAGTLLQARACYVCKTRFRGGRRVLPPALSALRGAPPPATRGAHRPERAAGAADRRPGEDRHVHRPAAAARRGRDDDHDALSPRRDPSLHGDARQRRVARAAARRRHRSARPRAGRGARRLGQRAGSVGHPDQQRRPDRSALGRGLRAADRGRARVAARGAAAATEPVRP